MGYCTFPKTFYVALTLQQLNGQSVLFLTIQFNVSFVCIQFECQAVLFDPQIEPDQVLPLQARVDLGAMVMWGTVHSPKLQHYWSLAIR